MDYGSIVRTLREKLGMSQTEFAKYINTSLSSVSRWENETQSPGPKYKKLIVRLAEEHEVEIKYFLYIRNKK